LAKQIEIDSRAMIPEERYVLKKKVKRPSLRVYKRQKEFEKEKIETNEKEDSLSF
jgi:hypothetical protein